MSICRKITTVTALPVHFLLPLFSSCTTTELSKLLNFCLTTVKNHVIKYCETIDESRVLNILVQSSNRSARIMSVFQET